MIEGLIFDFLVSRVSLGEAYADGVRYAGVETGYEGGNFQVVFFEGEYCVNQLLFICCPHCGFIRCEGSFTGVWGCVGVCGK